MEKYIYKNRICYRDVDKMGFVHHANYYFLFELARVDMTRAAGFPYRKIEEMGVLFPVFESNATYKKPISFDEEFVIETYLTKLKKFSFKVNYDLKNSSDELICSGYTQHGVISIKENEIVEMPEDFFEKIQMFLIKKNK